MKQSKQIIETQADSAESQVLLIDKSIAGYEQAIYEKRVEKEKLFEKAGISQEFDYQ